MLEIDPSIVLAAIHAERAKTDSEKRAWTSMWEKLGGMAAAVVLGIALSPALPGLAGGGCILCQTPRRVFPHLSGHMFRL